MNEDLPLNAVGYHVVRNAISKDAAAILNKTFILARDTHHFNQGLDSSHCVGDGQVLQCYRQYSAIYFEALLEHVRPIVEEVSGLTLFPSYSCARIYYNGATLEKHVDRPSCEISATMAIGTDGTKWPIYFTDLQGNNAEVFLEPGDMCVYRGTELVHWREAYTGNHQAQTFLHYVDAAGPYKDFKFDKRSMLGVIPQ